MSTPNLALFEPDPKQLLLHAMEMRWNNYCDEHKRCRSEFTEEAVHDLRVATRRMLALIQLLNSISPRPRLKKMARAFKDQLDEFDSLRDTQVILAGLSEILDEIPQLEEFEEYLHSREEQMLQDLRRKLKKRDTSELARWVRKTQETIEVGRGDDLKSMTLEAVDDAFLVTRQRLGWVDLTRSATIHRVRVAFKAFRYMVEIVHPLVQGFPTTILKQTNDYQTLMGNIQDVEVFAQTLAGFIQDTSLPDIDVIHGYYERRRSIALSTYAEAMDTLHTFWRPAPDQPFPWQQI